MRAMLAVVALAVLAPPAHAEYAGNVRVAKATVRYAGIDGHVYGLGFEVRSSGIGGTVSFRQLKLTITDCAGKSCAKPVTHVTDLEDYGESFDLSITAFSVRLGGLGIQAQWTSDPGWGKVPPRAGDGTSVAADQPATAVFLVGPTDGKVFRPTRCEDGKAVVSSVLMATTASPTEAERWPDREPAGMRLKMRSTKLLRCVR